MQNLFVKKPDVIGLALSWRSSKFASESRVPRHHLISVKDERVPERRAPPSMLVVSLVLAVCAGWLPVLALPTSPPSLKRSMHRSHIVSSNASYDFYHPQPTFEVIQPPGSYPVPYIHASWPIDLRDRIRSIPATKRVTGGSRRCFYSHQASSISRDCQFKDDSELRS